MRHHDKVHDKPASLVEESLLNFGIPWVITFDNKVSRYLPTLSKKARAWKLKETVLKKYSKRRRCGHKNPPMIRLDSIRQTACTPSLEFGTNQKISA